MIVKLFGQYIKENIENRSLKVLDKLINNDGHLLDESGDLIPNPYITRAGIWIDGIRMPDNYGTSEIIVNDKWVDEIPNENYEFPGGLDKNGSLIGIKFDGEYLLNIDGDRMEIPVTIRDEYNITDIYWKKGMTGIRGYTRPRYKDVVDKQPTGWVNVKVDMELVRKIKRFSSSLSDKSGLTGFLEKLDILENPSLNPHDDFTKNVQRKISAMTLLRYLKEIQNYFNPSSSGFLIESYMAGLVDGYTPGDNSYADVIDSNRETYQIKFYSWSTSTVDLSKKPPKNKKGKTLKKSLTLNNLKYMIRKKVNRNDEYSRNYIICLKRHNKINIWHLQTENSQDSNYIMPYLTDSGHLSLSRLKKGLPNRPRLIPKILNLANIDVNIENTGNDLREKLNIIWTNISELEYNVEAITTGVDKDHGAVEGEDYDDLYADSQARIETLEVEFENLRGEMRSDDE